MFKEQLNTNMKKSLTLIEVLISAVFLTIIFTGILFVFAKCIILNEHNRNVTVATMHAQYVMEEIRSTKFSDISGAVWNSTDIATVGLSPLNGEVVDVIVSVGDLLDITVNVTWNDLEERLNEAAELPNVQIQTYLAEP
ncbi:MAG: hypothetical protein KAI91_01570 [Candidatus Omnitrophica bacterium]|nr:hypothetical protein [Candidatus Omnitrophota bacterium]